MAIEQFCGNTRLREKLAAVAVSMVLVGCGGNDDEPTAPEEETVEPTTVPVPSATVGAPELSPTETQEQPGPTAASIGAGRIPALPTSQVLEFDQRIMVHESYGNEIVVTQAGLLRMIDVDNQAERRLLLSTDGLRAEIARGVLAGEHYLALVADSQSSWDLQLGVDLRTMQPTGVIPSDGNFTWVERTPNERRILHFHLSKGRRWLDVTTMTTLDAVMVPDTALRSPPLPDTGELAVWHRGGTISIHDPETMEEKASIDVGVEPLGGIEEAIVVISDRLLQYYDGGNTIGFIDRSTWEHLGVDPTYPSTAGPEFAVRYIRTKGTARLLAVGNGDERWYLLQLLDPDTGALLATHVVADGNFDRGWTEFTGIPGLAWVGDRLFVQDHPRRVVEVDLSRIGADTGAWVDPGLPWTPVLTAEEQEVADAVMAFLADVEGTPHTDNEGVQPALPRIAGYVGSFRDWQVADVLIDGDHAWSRALPSGPSVGYPVVLERVDGTWLISTDHQCYNASVLSNSTVC